MMHFWKDALQEPKIEMCGHSSPVRWRLLQITAITSECPTVPRRFAASFSMAS